MRTYTENEIRPKKEQTVISGYPKNLNGFSHSPTLNTDTHTKGECAVKQKKVAEDKGEEFFDIRAKKFKTHK